MKQATMIFADDFRTEPFWWETASPFACATALPETVDVLIVGGGFCGLSAGLRCVELGQSTLVVDAGPIGGQASSRSGAMLSSGQKFLLTGASSRFDAHTVREASRLHAEAFEYVCNLARREGLNFDLQLTGRLFLGARAEDAQRFVGHAEILRERACVTARVLHREELRQEIGTDIYTGGLLVEEFGGIHPSKLGRALAERFQTQGGQLASHCSVSRVERRPDGFTVHVGTQTLRSRHLLFATNGYSGPSFLHIKRRIAPVPSYIIATERLSPAIMRSVMPTSRMYSDTKRSLWYFRPSPERDRILFGALPGALPIPEHKAAVVLHGFLLRLFPQLAGIKLTHCWKGNIAMTSSRLQQIGAVNGVHYAVGCNGSGAAIMPYLGRIAAERMLGVRREPTIFETTAFRRFPPYRHHPWFVPPTILQYQLSDWRARRYS